MKTKNVMKSMNTLNVLTPKQMTKISGGGEPIPSGEATEKDLIFK
jgi:hypothetical protein